MTPLMIVPARQLSEGRPCKNREAWPALVECLAALPHDWWRFLVTDDPWLAARADTLTRVSYHYMDARHTVAAVARRIAASYDGDWPGDVAQAPVIILQPSSPTRNRAAYVRAAVELLARQPDISAVTSVVPWEGTPPSKACTVAEDGRLLVPSTGERRQDQPRAYRRDGTVYAVRRQYAAQGDLYGPHPVPLLVNPADSVTLD